jgi:arsenate reductase-like glutaredoxin family protein
MTRRCKDLKHMIFTKDKLLNVCQPRNVKWEKFIKNYKKAVNTLELQLDEWSTDDKDLVNEERSEKIRSERLATTNSVIKFTIRNEG